MGRKRQETRIMRHAGVCRQVEKHISNFCHTELFDSVVFIGSGDELA